MSLYINFTHEYKTNVKYDNVENHCDFLQQAYELQHIVFNNMDEVGKGGTMGMSGNHDAATLFARVYLTSKGFKYKNRELYNALRREHPQESDPQYIPAMRERLLRIALTCNGGWYLLAGDEFGVVTWPSVFDKYQEPEPLSNQWGGKANVSEYINFINSILQELPKTHLGDWVNHRKEIIGDNILQVVIRHSEMTNSQYIICSSDIFVSADNILYKINEIKSFYQNIKDIYFINQDKLFS